jgi:hypothetical protein
MKNLQQFCVQAPLCFCSLEELGVSTGTFLCATDELRSEVTKKFSSQALRQNSLEFRIKRFLVDPFEAALWAAIKLVLGQVDGRNQHI